MKPLLIGIVALLGGCESDWAYVPVSARVVEVYSAKDAWVTVIAFDSGVRDELDGKLGTAGETIAVRVHKFELKHLGIDQLQPIHSESCPCRKGSNK